LSLSLPGSPRLCESPGKIFSTGFRTSLAASSGERAIGTIGSSSPCAGVGVEGRSNEKRQRIRTLASWREGVLHIAGLRDDFAQPLPPKLPPSHKPYVNYRFYLTPAGRRYPGSE